MASTGSRANSFSADLLITTFYLLIGSLCCYNSVNDLFKIVRWLITPGFGFQTIQKIRYSFTIRLQINDNGGFNSIFINEIIYAFHQCAGLNCSQA